jgi:ABC-type lipoprotein release transport system permease subunit
MCLLILVIIIIVVIAALAMTNRIIFKMAVRNFSRRKIQSFIVICGLMIGTAIISSSLVVRDTMRNAFEEEVYRSLGEVDEEIWGEESWTNVAFFRYFSESIYDSMARNLSSSDPEGFESIIPLIRDNAAIFNFNTQLGEPSAAVMGFDSLTLRNSAFGDLDGKGFYPDALNDGEVAINSYLAEEMDASVGDTISISYGVKNPADSHGTTFSQRNFTIEKIIDVDELYGKARYNTRKAVFFELDFLQEMLGYRTREIIKVGNLTLMMSGAGLWKNSILQSGWMILVSRCLFLKII